MLIAILAVLDLTGIGLIRLPIVSITIMHIPVIIGAILMGPLYGGILGGAFGLISMLEATFRAGSPIDMLFSPFTTTNIAATLIMCFVPRILIGVVAGLLFNFISRYDTKRFLAIGISAVAASVTHTLLVLGMLWAFFSAIPFSAVFGTIIGLNGSIEIILAGIIAIAVCKPLLKILKI